jgi:hypothetical protein
MISKHGRQHHVNADIQNPAEQVSQRTLKL